MKVSKKTQAQAYAQRKLEEQFVEKFRDVLIFAGHKGNIAETVAIPNVRYEYLIREALGDYAKGELFRDQDEKNLVVSISHNDSFVRAAGVEIELGQDTINTMVFDIRAKLPEKNYGSKKRIATEFEKWAAGNFKAVCDKLAVAEKNSKGK